MLKNGFHCIHLLLILGLLNSKEVYAQSAIGQLENMSGGKVSRSSSLSSASMNSMVTGAILQSFFSSILSNPKSTEQLNAEQRAAKLEEQKAAELASEQQRIREAKAQADYDKMMQSYKLLDDAQNLKIKTLDNSDMEFKTLDGDAEALSSEARKQFEADGAPPASSTTQGAGTPFFGDALPPEDLQTLLDLNNNPAIVDLREADKFLEEEAAQDSPGMVTLLRKYETEGNGEPILPKPDCIRLRDQLKGYLNQREQFKKTIELSQNELNVWETANSNAMLNAAKDGLEYFTGELLQGLTNRGKVADRLQQVYNSKSRQMALDGINVAEIQTKIDRLRTISSTGQIADFASNVNDWESLVNNGMSTIIKRLTDSNNEIRGLLDAPQMKKYFETETPELNTLLDISKLAASNKIFGKWVAKKIPVVAVIELSIKQLYNGTDYLLSLNRILEAQKIYGGVMETAMFIQRNIDNTYSALTSCQ
jgi:hypothetical protein